jgi:hypothetical protein
MTFIGLHGVMSQKTELFIITAVRTPDLTYMFLFDELNGRKRVGRRLFRANRNNGQENVIKTALL